MIPDVIKFTGLEIEPQAILQARKHRGVVPPSWTRVRFTHDGSLHGLDRWLLANINGRYAVTTYSVSIDGSVQQVVVVAFEAIPDAVLFRLKEGETAWRPEVETEF